MVERDQARPAGPCANCVQIRSGRDWWSAPREQTGSAAGVALQGRPRFESFKMPGLWLVEDQYPLVARNGPLSVGDLVPFEMWWAISTGVGWLMVSLMSCPRA
jgi:hypothetical protein